MRHNALIKASVKLDSGKVLEGFGEVGLPPKKPHCYTADYSDVCTYVKQFVAGVEKHYTSIFKERNPEAIKLLAQYDPLKGVAPCYFQGLRQKFSQTDEPFFQWIKFLFYVLDGCAFNAEDFSRPPRYGLESAFFDLVGKFQS